MTGNRTKKDHLLLVLKGIAMGAADVVPGVSGGTIAFITGIYEELLDSIKAVNFKSIKLLVTGQLASFWNSVNGNFLITVLIGIAISFISLAKGVSYLLHNHPILVWSFFFGLIVASTVYVAREIKAWKFSTVVAAILGAAVAYAITVVSPSEGNTSFLFIFLSGAIAICAMILPGISGSFILVLLGMYRYMLDAIGNLNFPVIAVFIAGAGIGIISFSNLLSWLLKKYHNFTIAILTGFMIGSLNKIWPWKKITESITDPNGEVITIAETNILPGTFEQITGSSPMLGMAVLLAFTGFIFIFVIERIATSKA